MIYPTLFDLVTHFHGPKSWRKWSWIPLCKPTTIDYFKEWIKKGYHGEMEYLSKHLSLKENPKIIKNGDWQSLLIFQYPYVPHPRPFQTALQKKILGPLKIAKYAMGEDYHDYILRELNALGDYLTQKIPKFQYYAGTDSWPLLERDYGYQAGLGWVGKNTLLIDPKEGSFFFLAGILTNQPCQIDTLARVQDFCGRCQKCIDACPTGAIESPRLLNATKCIAYWNIESRKHPPIEIRAKMGNWFFGCDICQDVCPWNRKKLIQDMVKPSLDDLIESLNFLLSASDEEIRELIKGTPLNRAKPSGLRKNAAIVVINLDLKPLFDLAKLQLQSESN